MTRLLLTQFPLTYTYVFSCSLRPVARSVTVEKTCMNATLILSPECPVRV